MERGKVNCFDCECNNFCPRINLLSDEERENIQPCSDSEELDEEEYRYY